ncbi:hypothetical protein RQM65_02900 [Pricia sp. S334]|uniref:General stress protein CsbD n=1 Tax=Pricia mediterranea TaxID=3076079 RepID=A0ABU3L201_9FLAO|nr:hypothetical protein [Pricia sp. S334]MDT7827613.1 hypothetical protein [Pricia sp. S334]
MSIKRNFADDLDQGGDPEKDGTSDLNQYGNLHDKWNDIQEEYLKKYPDLETEDLYFEGGGFEGLLERIAEVREMTVKEIRAEIRNW